MSLGSDHAKALCHICAALCEKCGMECGADSTRLNIARNVPKPVGNAQRNAGKWQLKF